MAAFLSLKSRNWIALASLIALLSTQPSLSQTAGKERPGLPSLGDAEESNRFIVAFELTEENGFNFTWPFDSMRASSYETVVMVVEKMPRVRDENTGNESQPLIASRDLKINARRQKPYRVANTQSYFLVKLEQGRLRLALLMPPGTSIDPEHKVARIKLYEQ